MKKNLLSSVLGVLLLAGCASDINSNYYTTGQTGKVSTVSPCTVVSVRYVNVSNQSGAGTLIGSVAGGVAGSTIGSGSTAHTLGAVGGALLGGLVGDLTEQSASSQTGLEYIVKLDNGQIISISQGTGQALGVGQRCFVLFGSTNRVVPQ